MNIPLNHIKSLFPLRKSKLWPWHIQICQMKKIPSTNYQKNNKNSILHRISPISTSTIFPPNSTFQRRSRHHLAIPLRRGQILGQLLRLEVEPRQWQHRRLGTIELRQRVEELLRIPRSRKKTGDFRQNGERWQCVKTNSTPVVHIKIAGIYGCE